jgi:hypothetical protein
MYIPLMGFVTYILLSTLLAGLGGKFNPELLGSAATWASLVVMFEIMVIKLAIYLMSINNESQLLDLVAYSGYKFVGINVTLLLSEIWNRGGGTGGILGNAIFAYTYSANAYFLVRSLQCFNISCIANSSPLATISQIRSSARFISQHDKQRVIYFESDQEADTQLIPCRLRVWFPAFLYVGAD